MLAFATFVLFLVGCSTEESGTGPDPSNRFISSSSTLRPSPTISFAADEVEITCAGGTVSIHIVDFDKNYFLDLHNFLADENEKMLQSSVLWHRESDSILTYDEAVSSNNFRTVTRSYLTALNSGTNAISRYEMPEYLTPATKSLAKSYVDAIHDYWDFERRVISKYSDAVRLQDPQAWNSAIRLTEQSDGVSRAFDEAAIEACDYLAS